MSSAFPSNDPFRDPAQVGGASYGPPQYAAGQPAGPAAGGPFNPYGPKPVGPPQPAFGYPQSSKPPTSKLAITSMIASIASILLFCCVPSIVGSLVAVVTGSLAIYKIQRSNGQLAGMTQAIIGLVIGVPMLVISVAAMVMLFTADPTPAAGDPRKVALSHAESMINTGSDGNAHGNTPEAEALAERFSTTMQELREKLFTKQDKPGISLSGGQFITWCELHDDRCLFVVHVPSYRKFDDDAKESLAEIAWMAANATVADTLTEGDQLAVGMKGTFQYGAVMVGAVTGRQTEEGAPIPPITKDEDLLLPFFASDEDELEAEMALETPAVEAPSTGPPQFELPSEAPPSEDMPSDETAPPMDDAATPTPPTADTPSGSNTSKAGGKANLSPPDDDSNPLEGIADQPEDLVPPAPNGSTK